MSIFVADAYSVGVGEVYKVRRGVNIIKKSRGPPVFRKLMCSGTSSALFIFRWVWG